MREIKRYNDLLVEKTKAVYEIAKAARRTGLDPEDEPEIYFAPDVAARVEGLVGPEGVAERIRELKKDESNDNKIALKIAEEIALGQLGGLEGDAAIDKAIRSALALITNGVLVAPTEGISKIESKQGKEGKYLAIYYSGPIRSAGGTAQAMSVLIADHVRKTLKYEKFIPDESELGRYSEEIQLYNQFVRLQYKPTPEELTHILTNCPICITGDQTDQIEVSTYRDLPRVETNRLRGGACLVLAEGIAQKAPKLLKNIKKMNYPGWEWLEKIAKKNAKKSPDSKKQEKVHKFMQELPAGRPLFCEPNAKGGFRLRYGRSRTGGFASTSMHPALMYLVDKFIAIGTQIRLELPGKATVATPCDTIEGPIVRLKDGTVLQVEDVETAKELTKQVDKILFLGDLLIAFGDFLQNNHPLKPSGYVEEWWAKEVLDTEFSKPPYKKPTAKQAIELTKKGPLHPKHTHFWGDITTEELKEIRTAIRAGRIPIEKKPLFEAIGAFHKVKDNELELDPEHLYILKALLDNDNKTESTNTLQALKDLSGITIRDKAPVRVGNRMGRPEKAAMRAMNPAPNVLFPTGMRQGRVRSITKIANERKATTTELAAYLCNTCGMTFKKKCPKCGKITTPVRICPRCNKQIPRDKCQACNTQTEQYTKQEINIAELLAKAKENLKIPIKNEIKGVLGLTTKEKIPEALEKGILRANNNLYLFKDGTIRYDSTDVPLTHFNPREIGTTVEKLKELGYEKDIKGNPLENEEQILELYPQDILISDHPDNSGAKMLLDAMRFIDELLETYYKEKPFYNAKTKQDLIGHLVAGLAPHTSAAVVARIIGFTQARVGYAHPYFHAAKRRNCDGDEDSILLLLDALLNFSRKFLPKTIGGTMDAPLVLTPAINPHEIDTEPYDMEIVSSYPLEFYQATLEEIHPSKLADKIKQIGDVLDTECDWGFTHGTHDINAGPKKNKYTEGDMREKLRAQLKIARKIRAVDENTAATLVVRSHFLPDIKGNLRTFSNQKFRCVKCNEKYRRVPLAGKCTRKVTLAGKSTSCGGKILLTVHKGGVEKYLDISKKLIEEYKVPEYLRQNLLLLEMQLESVLGKDPHKQATLSSFN